MPRNLRSTLTFLLGWPLSLIALFFLIKSFLPHLSTLSQIVLHPNWLSLSVGFICFVGYYYLRSFIWYKLLQLRNHKLDTHESLFQWSNAQLRRYIPGNIWGIVGISLHFEKRNVPRKDIAASVLTESQLVVIAAIFLSLLSFPLLAQLFIFPRYLQTLAVIVVSAGTVIYFFSSYILSKFKKTPKFILFLFPPFSFERIISLWVMMIIAFLFYGIGTYFIVTAFTYLSPLLFWQFVGFFILSLLVGFVSFITPTGLGVREGAIALGLKTVMSGSLAAFVAIVARGVLIFSELFAIGIMYLFHKYKQTILVKFSRFVAFDPHRALLVSFYTIFVGYFSWISILRFENYYAGRFDLGNMEQTVWNSLHGHIFEFTNPNGTTIVSRLAFHADFILVLLAPLYAFWQDPRFLLVIQTAILGLGTFFVYEIAQLIIKRKNVSLLIACLYLLNPSLERSVIYDFHAVTLATTFLLGAFYFMYKKKYTWFVLLAVLAGICKEEIWAITGLFGFYIIIVQKKKLLGSLISIGSLSALYILIWKIIPQVAGTQHFALSYYSNGEVTDSPTSLIKLFLFSPLKTFSLLTDSARLIYLNQLFLPIGYLGLFAPLMLIFAAPDLVINLLSTKAELHQIYYQYTAAVTPFLFIATIYGTALLMRRLKKIPEIVFILYLAGTGLYSAYLYGPLPGAKSPNLDMITRPMTNRVVIDRLLAAIPAKYSVSTSNSLGSHVTHRPYLFTMPYGWDDADYIVFLMNETNAYPSLGDHKKQAETLSHDHRFVKYYDDGIVKAFRKKTIIAPTGL